MLDPSQSTFTLDDLQLYNSPNERMRDPDNEIKESDVD